MKNLKKYNYLFYTFLISFIIVTVIYKLQDIAPLGKNSMLTVDFFHQYGPMLAEFFDRLHSGESLIYSFNLGLGIPFYRNFFNYMSSPLNIIIFLFNRNNLIMSYSIIIGLRAALSATTMAYFLKNKLKITNYTNIGLSILYAFSAYFTAYYWNIMWLDGLIFLPLIILGIENIINKNNGILYTISLTIMLYSNYFIGYMICIFSVIYFISYLMIKTTKFNIKKILKTCFKFCICSLIAGCLVAWALIPMYDALTSTNATTGSMPTDQYYAFSIPNFLFNMLTGVQPTVFASDISNCPNVSCGILGFALFILFLLTNKISIKRKIIYSLILILLLSSFYFGPLDYIWHAFHVPNDLPYRYSFIFTFIIILCNGYALKHIEKTDYYKVLITYLLAILLITLVLYTEYDNISNKMIRINYILITIYFLTYNLYKFYPKFKKLAIVIFTTTIAIECIISINSNWNILQYIDDFYYDYKDINTSIKTIKEKDKDKFYRTEKNYILTFNDGAWYDYYGQTTFSSMTYNSLAELNNNLGQPGNYINSFYYKQNTPVYDLMYDIKYTIGYNNDNKRYLHVLNENGTNTYKFKYTTSLMFGVNEDILNWNYNYTNPLEYQNDFIYKATNIDSIFYKLNYKNSEILETSNNETIIKFTYNNPNDNIYIYENNYEINYIIIKNTLYYKNSENIYNLPLNLNDLIYDYKEYNEQHIINENINEEVFDIYISYKNYYDEHPNIYSIDNDKFVKAYNYLNKNKVEITSFKEHYIEGKINTSTDQIIYTSIPYDKGWNVYVNGKQTTTFKISDSLLGFKIPKGNNIIELKYIPNNIDVGLSITLITIIYSTTYLLIKRKKLLKQHNNKTIKKLNNPS